MVLENTRAIIRASRAISLALDDFIGAAQTAISTKQQNVHRLSNRLRQLPALEMQLGELVRNQKIYADIYSAVLGSYNRAKVADAVESSDFYVMDYAVAPLPPPADPSRLVVLCVLIAILISFGPVLGYDFFDKSVRSQRQLSRITGNIVLEAIPLFSQVNGRGPLHKPVAHPLINVPCDPNFTREIFDSLLVKIKLRLFESADHCVAVSSFEGGCGKSTVSANLAIAIALRGHRTLLVDGDLRRGTVKEIFRLPDSGGLATLLSGHDPLTDDDCIQAIIATKIPGLYVLPSGREPPNPGALLSSPRMEEFRRFCGKYAAYTVMDTPPLGIVSDAVVIQKLFAHYIFVVRSGKTKVAELVNRINEFDRLSEKIIGYVLNGASHNAVGTYRRYSNYYVRPRLLPEAKRKSVILSPAVILPAAALVCLGIAGIIIIPHSFKRSGQMQIAAAAADPMPEQSMYRSAQPAIEASQPAPKAAPDKPESKAPTPRNQSGISAADSTRETLIMRSAATTRVPITTSKKTGTNAAELQIIDRVASARAILREIRSRFARGDLAGLGPIFGGPALDDGEYYLLMARYLCDTGGWRNALPLVEKAIATPAQALSRDKLTIDYLICKAKCYGAAFGAEPTPDRGAAAMEAWYNVEYQFRGAPQDSRYLYADSERRRISKEIKGK